MTKKDFLIDFKKDFENNLIFNGLIIKAIELHDRENPDNEKHYFFILETLENYYNEYINYNSIIYDIALLLKRRFNDDREKENILKAIDLLIIKE